MSGKLDETELNKLASLAGECLRALEELERRFEERVKRVATSLYNAVPETHLRKSIAIDALGDAIIHWSNGGLDSFTLGESKLEHCVVQSRKQTRPDMWITPQAAAAMKDEELGEGLDFKNLPVEGKRAQSRKRQLADQELFKRYYAGHEAFNELANRFIPFATKKGLTLTTDMRYARTTAFYKAVRTFNSEHSTSFQQVFDIQLRRAMRAPSDEVGAVALNNYHRLCNQNLRTAQTLLAQKGIINPSYEELAEVLRNKPQTIKRWYESLKLGVSTANPFGDGSVDEEKFLAQHDKLIRSDLEGIELRTLVADVIKGDVLKSFRKVWKLVEGEGETEDEGEVPTCELKNPTNVTETFVQAVVWRHFETAGTSILREFASANPFETARIWKRLIVNRQST